MREYALVYDAGARTYMIIVKDPNNEHWSIFDRDLRKTTAEMALKGLKS